MAIATASEIGQGGHHNIVHDDTIIIVGAEVFGLSTAFELAKRGYSNATVFDRYPPPVPDGSSVDISRVIRPDYADDFYAKLEHPYIEQSRDNIERHGGSVHTILGGKAVQDRFPGIDGHLADLKGYFNPICGWGDAEGSIRNLAQRCASLGVSFVHGPRGTVTSLLIDGGAITGIETQSGNEVRGDYFILATGAWSPYLIDMGGISVSNAQPVAFLQLTPSEAEALSENPVIIDLSTG
ncbi:hypothetical protein E8E11_009288 [Didymella keratinophila]|nr:hypothetical protein E8E11_009288 [Didymella keratinophila]